MHRHVWVVQHGEKHATPGDPGLTREGHEQARATAWWLATHVDATSLWSSPLRRAVETADHLAEALGLDVRVDPRLRERMNWEDPQVQSLEAFLDDWLASTRDRAWRPPSGDSSAEAGRRFLDVLAEVAASDSDVEVVLVAHGGITTDALRDLLGDDELRARAPRLLDHGVPPCAITELVLEAEDWTARAIATVDHLAGASGLR